MKRAIMSNCRNPQYHSKKDCVCGSHSANDRKKSKHHNSTKVKLNNRILRKFKRFINNQIDLDEEFNNIVNENFNDLL